MHKSLEDKRNKRRDAQLDWFDLRNLTSALISTLLLEEKKSVSSQNAYPSASEIRTDFINTWSLAMLLDDNK